jgi:hypothetical protein
VLVGAGITLAVLEAIGWTAPEAIFPASVFPQLLMMAEALRRGAASGLFLR